MSTTVDGPISILGVAAKQAAIPSLGSTEYPAQFHIETTTDIDTALSILTERRPECVFIGPCLTEKTTRSFIEQVRDQHPTLPIFVSINEVSDSVTQKLLAAGATDCVDNSQQVASSIVCNRIENAVAADRAGRVAARQEQTLEHFFEESPLGAIQWDGSFRFDRINKRAEAMLGYTEAELKGDSWERIVAEEDHEHVATAVEKLLTADGGVEVVNKNIHKDGEVRIYKWHNQAVTDQDGSVQSIFSKFHDVTESVERKAELEKNETIIETLSDGIYVLDERGNFTFVNDAFVELVGYDRETILGNSPALIKSEASIERAEQELAALLSSDGPETAIFEVAIERADGETVLCEDQMGVLPYEGDSFVGSVGTLRDITEQKQREFRYQALVEQTNDIISVVDADGRFQYQSQSIERILGYTPAETIGDLAWEYIHPDDRSQVKTAFAAWGETKDPIREPVEYRARHADGSWRWMEASGRAHAESPGDSGYLINSREITARKERQQQLELFDRVLRHNIRNDMNVIRGSADTIRSMVTGDAAWLAGKIQNASNRLLATTKKQREITKLLRESPAKTEVKIRPILEEIQTTMQSAHPDASVSIDCESELKLETTASLSQALEELVTNAIIHNDGDTPTVAVTVTQSDEQVRISITDNGPRISEMERELIKNPEDRSSLYHGSGLGLWLVRQIMSQSGGTVQFSDTPDSGNTITLTLPQSV